MISRWTLAVHSRLWVPLSWDFQARASEPVSKGDGIAGSMLESPDRQRETSTGFFRPFSRTLAWNPTTACPHWLFLVQRKKTAEKSYRLCLARVPGGVPLGFLSADERRGAKSGRPENSANSSQPCTARV